MLTFFNSDPATLCDGLSRRGFLRVGGLALGGLALPDFLRLRAEGAVAPGARPKSVIMICLGGGPSHVDTYDMKPDAPAEIRGEFRPMRTNVAGMELSELLPLQAKISDKFAVVRSVTWQEPDHQRIEIFTTAQTGCRPCSNRTARCCLFTTVAWQPSSATCTIGVCTRTCAWLSGANSGAPRGSTNSAGATTGRRRAACCFRAGA